MPRIPEYQPQVGMAAAPSARANADITNPLGSIGEGMQRFGAQLNQIGEAADAVAVTDAQLKALREMNDLQGQMYSRLGLNAKDAPKEFAVGVSDIQARAVEGLNDRQKQMFVRQFTPHAIATEEAVNRHARGQLIQATGTAFNSKADLAISAAEQNATDPDQRRLNLDMLKDAVDSMAKLHGMDEATKTALLDDKESKFHSGVINRLAATGDVEGAWNYFEGNKARIGDEFRTTLGTKIQQMRDFNTAQKKADEYLAQSKGEPLSMIARAEKENSGVVRDLIVKRLNAAHEEVQKQRGEEDYQAYGRLSAIIRQKYGGDQTKLTIADLDEAKLPSKMQIDWMNTITKQGAKPDKKSVDALVEDYNNLYEQAVSYNPVLDPYRVQGIALRNKAIRLREAGLESQATRIEKLLDEMENPDAGVSPTIHNFIYKDEVDGKKGGFQAKIYRDIKYNSEQGRNTLAGQEVVNLADNMMLYLKSAIKSQGLKTPTEILKFYNEDPGMIDMRSKARLKFWSGATAVQMGQELRGMKVPQKRAADEVMGK